MTKVKTALVIFICGSLVVGCGGDKDEKKAPSQVLAKVNDKEITVLQLNYLLARQPKADNDTKQMLLDNLVEQELLVQQAEALKLDRNPDVLQNVEFAKRQVLAQAAMEKLIGQRSESTLADVKEFYQKHKNIFADRYIFDIDVFLVKASDMTGSANLALETSANGIITKQILEKDNIAFKQTQAKRAAEEMPDVVLVKLMEIKPGDIVKVPDNNGNLVLMQLINKTEAPISEADAEKSIRQLLANTKIQNDAKNKINNLKTTAKIEYLKNFADKKVTSSPTNDVAPSTSAESTTDEHLKSGLKGLN